MTISIVPFVFRNYDDLWEVARKLEQIEDLNFGSEGFDSSFIAQELTNKNGAAVLLLSDGEVVGYTAAMDAREAYATNRHYYGRNHGQAAYVSNSSIHPEYQHKGHIWLMTEMLEVCLRLKGYSFLDQDARSDLGYAKKIISHYGERVIFAHSPEETMWGNQQYIRIKL